jgi:hypothetical protein
VNNVLTLYPSVEEAESKLGIPRGAA